MTAEFDRMSQYMRLHEDLTKQMITSSNRPEVALKLVKLEVQAKNFEGAVPLLTKLLKLHPDDIETLGVAVSVYEGIGDRNAVAYYRSRLASVKKTVGKQ